MPAEPMTSARLISMLRRIDPAGTLVVRIWDADADEYMPVTGAAYGDGDAGIDLCSDSDECDDDTEAGHAG